MQNSQEEVKVVFPGKFQISVLMLFALSVFLFVFLVLILVTYSAFNSVNDVFAIALGLSTLATWPLYTWMKKPHLKNAFIQFDLFIFIGAFITSVLGTFLSGYLVLLFWPNQFGPLPALFLTTPPCFVMGLLFGSICWHQIFEYDEHHAVKLYTYVSLGAILFGLVGLLAGIYVGLVNASDAIISADVIFTTPCGMVLGIYIGWRLWRLRYYKRTS